MKNYLLSSHFKLMMISKLWKFINQEAQDPFLVGVFEYEVDEEGNCFYDRLMKNYAQLD